MAKAPSDWAADDVLAAPAGSAATIRHDWFGRYSEFPCLDYTAAGWSVPRFPEPGEVRSFFQLLSIPYAAIESAGGATFADADAADVPSWYQVVEPGVLDPRQGVDWVHASDDGLEAVALACSLLDSYVVGALVHRWKDGGGYPAGWGWGSGVFRSTVDRLLDRLHLQHASYRGRTVRVSHWWDRAGEQQEPLETPIAFSSEDHPVRSLLNSLARDSVRDSFAVHVFGDYFIEPYLRGWPSPTDSFAFPLHWAEALEWGLWDAEEVEGQGHRLTVPEELREVLSSTGTEMENLLSRVPGEVLAKALATAATEWVAERFGELIAGVVLWDPDWPGEDPGHGLIMSREGRRLEVLLDVADPWPDALGDAAGVLGSGSLESDPPDLNDSLAHLTWAAMVTDLVGSEFDLGIGEDFADCTWPKLAGLAEGLSRLALPTYYRESWDTRAMVWLHDTVRLNAAAFEDFAEGDLEPDDRQVRTIEQAGWELWVDWWNAAAPSADAARIAYLVGEIVRQLVNADDAWCLVFAAARADNEVGPLVAGSLPVAIPPPADVIGYLVRQVLTDAFVEYFATYEGIDRECLYPLFCWMASADQRERIEAALGPLVEVELPDGVTLLSAIGLGEAVRTFPCRSCLLPGSDDEGLGVLLPHVPTGFRGLDFAETAEVVAALARVTRWWEDARETCTSAIEARLRPGFHFEEPRGDPGDPGDPATIGWIDFEAEWEEW